MKSLFTFIVIISFVFISGCKLLEVASDVGAAVGQATGTITPGQAESIKKSAGAVSKAMEDITPEQEYYIGRAVAATILKTYKPLNNEAANKYVNLLGQSLAAVSDKPETFKGYHFLIMDTDEINAFAAPSGFILVSRGLIKCCTTETELAAVLAHEVGHVQNNHGLKAIKKGRITSALTTLGLEAGKNLGGQQLAEVTKAFEGSISDITSTLVNKGYARALEIEADKAAIAIMQRIGYNPTGLERMLMQMDKKMENSHEQKGFAATHPSPKQRLKEISSFWAGTADIPEPQSRQMRFQSFINGL